MHVARPHAHVAAHAAGTPSQASTTLTMRPAPSPAVTTGRCSQVEEGINFVGGDLYNCGEGGMSQCCLVPVTDAAECCNLCAQNQQCGAYSFEAATSTCNLKDAARHGREERPGYVSANLTDAGSGGSAGVRCSSPWDPLHQGGLKAAGGGGGLMMALAS